MDFESFTQAVRSTKTRLQNSFRKLRRRITTIKKPEISQSIMDTISDNPCKSENIFATNERRSSEISPLTENETRLHVGADRLNNQEYSAEKHLKTAAGARTDIYPAGPEKNTFPEIVLGKCEECNRITELQRERSISNVDNFLEQQSRAKFYPSETSLVSSNAEEAIIPRDSSLNKLVVHCKNSYDENRFNVYKNSSMPRGLIFMINFLEFEMENIPTREGSERDYTNLLNLFQQMGYKCDVESGFCRSGKISREEFFTKFSEFSQLKEHENLDSCIVVIMSHGAGDKTFLSSEGGEIRVEEIHRGLNNTNCPSLTGKPKIFIFQFCRISESDAEERWNEEETTRTRREASAFSKYSVRSRPDQFNFQLRASSISSSVNRRNSQVLSLISTNSSVFTDSGCEDYENGHTHYSPRGWKDGGPSDELPAFASSTSFDLATKFQFPPTLEVNYSFDSIKVEVAHNERVQCNSDLYSIFSTVGGEVAYRDPKKGSLLIQALCIVLAKNAWKDNIEELCQKVSQLMLSMQNDCDNPCAASQKQTCERINIGFDRNFYFNPQNLSAPHEKTSDKMFY